MSPQRTRDALVQELISRESIMTALAVHSRGIDRADANLLASAYHPDAEVDYSFFVGPAAQLVSMLVEGQKGQQVTMHRTSNIWIKVDGRRARSESYVVAYMADSTPVQRLIGGRYLDTHEERSGEWRLTSRTYVMDFNINRASASQWADPARLHSDFAPRGGQGAADAGRTLLALYVANFQSKDTPNVADKNGDARIDEALAKQDLHELVMAYARAVDRADANLLASVFHDDATVMAGLFNGNAKEYSVKVVNFVRKTFERCFHSIANEWYEVHGDRAIGESYVFAHTTADGKDTLLGGRYVDEFECRDGQWKIKTRAFVLDWNNSQSTSFESGGMYGALTRRGCFGAEDPVYAFWGH